MGSLKILRKQSTLSPQLSKLRLRSRPLPPSGGIPPLVLRASGPIATLIFVKIQISKYARNQKFGNKSKYASRRFVRSLRDLEIRVHYVNINKQSP